jgi:predicted  nucleic acid-binding Zn-ribbon protein
VTIEATVQDIHALLELARADGAADPAAPEDRRQSRDALARRVPRRLLDPYELLRGTGRSPVVVTIARGACSGCHVRLPTMVEVRARCVPAVHRCPRCRRLLYAPELILADAKARDAKASAESATRSGGRQP